MKDPFPTRVLRFPVRRGRRLANRLLHRVECRSRGRDSALLEYPPVFIIGAPRCGSTLLYQVMLQCFDFGYISNLHCLFYGAPSLAERFVRPGRWKRPSGFESEHGRISGWNAPSECGDYWYRFFRRHPQYVPLSEADDRSLRDLRRSIRALGAAMGRSLLLKNLPCALRLEPILKALPESLFVVVQRNWLETAHSILEARLALFGGYDGWFSVEPPQVETFKQRPPHEQVVEQIRSVHALIEDARAVALAGQFLDVDYGWLCRDTHAVLGHLEGFLQGNGVTVRCEKNVPRSFQMKEGVRIDRDLYCRVKDYLAASS